MKPFSKESEAAQWAYRYAAGPVGVLVGATMALVYCYDATPGSYVRRCYIPPAWWQEDGLLIAYSEPA